jgi:hypothetical protein
MSGAAVSVPQHAARNIRVTLQSDSLPPLNFPLVVVTHALAARQVAKGAVTPLSG